jgi:hypothetical protein
MKVLLTGSTAAHVSQDKNERSMTFTGLLSQALLSGGHQVTWTEPSVTMTKKFLSEFDSVIVGLSPPTSTAAHRIYGSLSVLYNSWNIGNLTLLVDAPEPKRIWVGLNSVRNNPEYLTKDFYSKRKEFASLKDDSVLRRVSGSIELLCAKSWPTTIYPELPWMSSESLVPYIPMLAEKDAIGMCFDRNLVENSVKNTSDVPEFWLSDHHNSSWSIGQERLSSLPVMSLKQSKWERDIVTRDRLAQSIGCLVSTHSNNEPWWSAAIPLALSSGAPVVSDWLLTSVLGESWRVLSSNVEGMSHIERSDLLREQVAAYANSLLVWNDSVDLLTRSLVD